MQTRFRKRPNCILLGLVMLLAACTSTGSQVDALSSVVEEQKKQQDIFFEQQKKLVESQKQLAEETRQKQLALIEENRLKLQTAQALSAKPSDLAKAQQKQTARPPVKKASAGGASRSAGNIKLNAPWKCVPDKLKAVIREVSRRYGAVIVNSTYRSRSKNRRVGGASRSYHLRCQAVDFRVRGDGRKVLRFLRNHPHVGGLKRYRSGYFHIDTGPRRTWRG